MRRIDAHIHFCGDTDAAVRGLKELDLKLLNICVAGRPGRGWREKAGHYRMLADKHPGTYAWCTSFDLPDFQEPGYAKRVIEELDADFTHGGAVAVKGWKNIGMEVRKPDGSFLQIDDEIFTPVFEWLERNGRSVLLHMAEPLACWRPLEDNKPHCGYYRAHPEWHMYNKPEYPSHETIMAARDRLLARHPKLRIVGAHLGSLEYDVDEIAKRFDAYPNFAVDTSARLWDLVLQPTEKVRAFLRKYADRVLHGTDLVRNDLFSTVDAKKAESNLNELREETAAAERYYAGTDVFTYRGSQVQGLGLPGDIVEKLFKTNARAWYPEL